MRNRTVTKGDILLKFLPSNLREKFKETLKAVLPIIAIVLVLCFTIAPISPSIILMFLVGGVLLIMGMLLFNVGVDISMTPMGERVGTTMTKSKNIFIMIALSFLLGVMITISEPDLQVLAGQVPSIPNMVLILTVAVGVGFFLVLALVRMLFGIQLSHMLLVFYAVVFTLAYFVPGDFLAVAFDSGGVTTGPMTVPFIMALGVGISAIRSDKRAADDSFGLVALCSIGPILAAGCKCHEYWIRTDSDYGRYGADVACFYGGISGIYEGDSNFPSANHCFLLFIPVDFKRYPKAASG